MLECVVNISEGRRRAVIDALASVAGASLLDVHSDVHHHRTVLSLAGPDVELAARAVATEAVARIDLAHHTGAHPRLGAVDVVPFVALAGSTPADAVAARDHFADWAAAALGLPCFLYGPERPLPEVRRRAFAGLEPDVGPRLPHLTAGAACVGARPVLVAYNLWLAAPAGDLVVARAIAAGLRSERVRALGLDLDGSAQVSLNLLDPYVFGPADAYDRVAALAPVQRAELVGLAPAAVLETVPADRWPELDLDPANTIERRLEDRSGRFGPARLT